MEGIGQFDQNDGTGVPRYDRRGRLLTEEEREKIAVRRGLCVRCGTQTHAKQGVLKRKALTNENVYDGVCIKCNPRRVPSQVFDAWDARNRPLMTAPVTQVSRTGGFGHSSTDLQNASTRSGAPGPSRRFPGPPSSGHARSTSSGSTNGPSSGHARSTSSGSTNGAASPQRRPNKVPSVQSVQQQPPATNGTARYPSVPRNFPDGSNNTLVSSGESSRSQYQTQPGNFPRGNSGIRDNSSHQQGRIDSQGSFPPGDLLNNRLGQGSGHERTRNGSMNEARGMDTYLSNRSVDSVNAVDGTVGEGHAKNDSQRSIGSVLTASTNESSSTPTRYHDAPMTDLSEHSSQDEGPKRSSTLEDEKAALGFKRTAPATRPGVQSVLSTRSDGSVPSSTTDVEETKVAAGRAGMHHNSSTTSLDTAANEKASYRSAPALKPGVQSVSSTRLTAAEPGSTAATKTPAFDEKASYRSAPASKPGVQSVSSTRSLDSSDGGRAERPFRMSGNFEESSPAASLRKQGADLKLSLQDNFRGDEIKLSTEEYIQQLGESLEDSTKLRTVLHNLRNIEDEDQIDSLLPIKEILSHCASDTRLGDVTAGVLWRTAASSDDAKVEVMRSGAIDVILDSLKQHGEQDSELCQWSLGVLTSVAFNMENREIIAEKGGIETVLAVLSQHKKHAGVFEWACRCLHNLVFCYDDEGVATDHEILHKNITSAEEAGAVAVVIDAMSINSTEHNAQLWAMKLLWRLLDSSSTTDAKRRLSVMHRVVLLRKLAAADFISIASKLLRQQSTTGELQQLTTELMTVVILGSGSDHNMFKAAVMLDKATQCVPNIVRGMQQTPDDAEVQASGCRLLSALCNSSGDVPPYLVEQGVIEVIAAALTRLQSDSAVAEAGTWALWKLSSELQQAVEAIPVDVATVRLALGVLGAVAARHEAPEIQRCVNSFTLNMCGTNGLTVSDFPVADLASGFFQDPQAGGADVLAMICSKFPQSCVTVLEGLDPARIVSSLNESKADVQSLLLPILITASEESTEARNLMISSGVLSAAVAVLSTTQDKEQCTLLLDLITYLSSADSSVEENASRQMPDGFCETIQKCLDRFGSDEVFCIKVLQPTICVIVQSSSADQAGILLPWLANRLDSLSCGTPLKHEACKAVWAIAAKRQITNAVLLRDLLNKVLALMVKFNGDNGPEFNLQIQHAAAGALGGIAACIRDTHIPVEPQQIDTFMGSVYKARPLGAAAKDFMLNILVAIWRLCFVHEAVLLQSGVIILVMDIMATYREDADVQGKCCLILAQLASSENIQITLSIVETDGVQMLLEALASFPTNRAVQKEASRCLAHLSTDDETRMLVSAMGGISLLEAAVTAFSDDLALLEHAYSALMNLTSDVPEQFLDSAAVVRAVVRTMERNPDSTSLRENGLGILQNVCMKGAAAKEIIAVEGGITTVIREMQRIITTPTVLERSFSTLWSLAVLPANQGRIAQAGGVDMVVLGMYAYIEYERVQQQGCGCMFTLALDSNNRMAFRNAGGVDAVTLSSKAHFGSVGVQAEVCKCLAGLSTPGEGQYQIQSITQDEVDSVVFAMQRFQNVHLVQIHGCTALYNFLFARNASEMVSTNREAMAGAVERASNHFHSQCSAVAQEFSRRLREFV